MTQSFNLDFDFDFLRRNGLRYKANFKYSSAIFEGELMRTRSKHEDSFDIDNYIARLRVRTVVGAVWFTQVELGAVASAL